MTTWGDLNERQRAYLEAIYDQDQENEAIALGQQSNGDGCINGIIPELNLDSPLRSRLRTAQLIDEGTGSTFTALADRHYIVGLT